METVILPVERWPLVAPIVRAEFANAMPANPDGTLFLAAMEDEKLAGFLHVEQWLHFNSVYVAPEFRSNGLALKLMEEASSLIPQGHSAVWLTNRNAGQLATKLGARDLGVWRFYRKDA